MTDQPATAATRPDRRPACAKCGDKMTWLTLDVMGCDVWVCTPYCGTETRTVSDGT